MPGRSLPLPSVAGLALLLLVSAPASGQELTRDEVLANYYEAVGGLEEWRDVRTLRASGRMTLPQGMTVPFRLYSKRPSKMRVEFDARGTTAIQAYDGETAWMIMPFTGSSEPREIPAPQADAIRRDADFDGPIMGWKEDGHAIELVGTDTVDGDLAYRLDVTLQDGDVEHYFLDAGTFLPVRISGTRTVQGTRVEYHTELGDYRTVNGLMMAHSIESGVQGGRGGSSMTIDTVRFGVSVPDSLFSMPGSGDGNAGGSR